MGPETMAAYHAGAEVMIPRKGLISDEEGRDVVFMEHLRVPVGAPSAVAASALTVAEAESSDEDDYLDDEALEQFRRLRMAEIDAARDEAGAAAGAKRPRVELITKDDWQARVVEASSRGWVLVHLHDDANDLCAGVLEALEALPEAVVDGVTCLRIAAEHAMPRTTFHLLPGLIAYLDGALAAKLIGLELLRDRRNAPSAAELEWKLAQIGVVASDLAADPALARRKGDDDDDDDDDDEGDFDDGDDDAIDYGLLGRSRLA